MVPYSAFTTKYNGIVRALENQVMITPAGIGLNKSLTDSYRAIWDTGATGSVISKNIVEKLELRPVSICKVATPAGVYDAYCYYINLTLPNNVTIPNLLVMEAAYSNCDILIGMDVISQGDFSVTSCNGQTTFSFRIPSICDIDFVKNSYLKPIRAQKVPERNEKCPCGSGKKYKNCCGK